jgi:class 3 adenylate cyclase
MPSHIDPESEAVADNPAARRSTVVRSDPDGDLSENYVSQSKLKGTPVASQPTLETAHVLFMDIVSYATLLTDQQPARLQELQEIVRATTEFQNAQKTGRLLRLPTGDGMALSFFDDLEAPLRCAVEIGRALRTHPNLKLRMGVHSGLVYRIADINENLNISGGGINLAQRVMDCGDAGHILLSRRVADDLGQLSRWTKDLHDLGEAEVKHGVRIHIYNLHNEHIGNSARPRRLTPPPRQSRRLMPVVALAGLLLVLVAGWFAFQDFSPGVQPGNQNVVTVPNLDERRFVYYLVPTDKSLNAEDERYAGNELFHNGSEFTFVLIPEQAGALYLLNQGSGKGGAPALNVLFPTPKNNNGSSMIKANQRVEVQLEFDPYSGDELVSIIWTKNPSDDLDVIFKKAAGTNWEVRNSTEIETVKKFLNEHQSPAPKAEVNPEKKQTTVSGNGEILISARVFKHRDF